MTEGMNLVESAKLDKSPSKKITENKKMASKSSNHPPTSEMVKAAISALHERKGSSMQAIKKFIAANYDIDIERHTPFIRKFLKSAVQRQILVQTSGQGCSGSFKLAKEKTPIAKKSVKTPTGEKKEKNKSPSKKRTEKLIIKTSDKKNKSKSPSKVKKNAKSAVIKPTTPKPKKASYKPRIQ